MTVHVRDVLKSMAPEEKVLAAIRNASRKKETSKLSMREINREIRAYRRERSRSPKMRDVR